ncbi:MAG: helix-turn-helix domain-containing protein [Oligoflexus sp.]
MNYSPINDRVELGKVIRARRKELNITQVELAAYANIAKNLLTRIETAQTDVRLSTLLKISKFLGFKITIELEE